MVEQRLSDDELDVVEALAHALDAARKVSDRSMTLTEILLALLDELRSRRAEATDG